jgi:hypothetical protein
VLFHDVGVVEVGHGFEELVARLVVLLKNLVVVFTHHAAPLAQKRLQLQLEGPRSAVQLLASVGPPVGRRGFRLLFKLDLGRGGKRLLELD